MTGAIDIDAIRRDFPVDVVARPAMKLVRAGNEWKGCCPFHEDRSPSFTIFDNGRRWHCFGCGASGDVLDFVQRAHGVTLREAADLLGHQTLPTIRRAAPVDREERSERIEEARAIWRSAGPIAGTLAENYLRQRGILAALPESLRFARLRYGTRGEAHPCLVALVTSPDHHLSGIQRTYLNAAGNGKAAVPKPKLSLGRVKGGAIRLAPAAREIALCEGLEDGLTLMQELGRAIWVAAGAGMMPAMQLPDGCSSVVIGADGDAAGERAAQAAGEAFIRQGRQVRVIRPMDGFKDFNDELREKRS